jgi:hypothetical protein
MGLSDLKRKLKTSVDDLDQARLQDRWAGVGLTAIADAPPRQPVRIGGEVKGLQVVPRAGSPSLEVTIADGSGRAVAVFTGRKRLGGVDPGRGIVIEGVGRLERNRLVLLNPAYQLLPA